MIRYRLLDSLDWTALNGQKVTVEVSTHYVLFVTADGTLHKVAKSVQPRPPRATHAHEGTNGKPYAPATGDGPAEGAA